MEEQQKVWRLYLDTSVFGGVFDVKEGFDQPSRKVMEALLGGQAIMLYSTTVEDEIARAPQRVRELFADVPPSQRVRVELTEEAKQLAEAYREAAIVSERWLEDSLHVAAASVAGADAIVSWNFKHIIRLDKIKAYNVVNRRHGYCDLTIMSPHGVNFDA